MHYDADGKHYSKHFAVERDMVQYFVLHRNSIDCVNFLNEEFFAESVVYNNKHTYKVPNIDCLNETLNKFVIFFQKFSEKEFQK